jgi:hypothetical protein
LHVDLLKLFSGFVSREKCLLPVRKESIVKFFFTISGPDSSDRCVVHHENPSHEKNLWKKGNPIFLPKVRLNTPVKDGLMMKQG